MSLRLWIRAVDLDLLKSWVGSDDQTVSKQLLSALDDWLQPQNDEDQAVFKTARNSIQGLIKKGAENIEIEGEGEVMAGYTMAISASANPQPWEDENEEEEWSWADVYDLATQFGKNIDKKGVRLLDLICQGRPLFGKKFGDDCGWYCYLTKAEVKDLNHAITKMYEDTERRLATGALNEIDFDSRLVDVMQYLSQHLSLIEDHEQDMFIYAS